MKLHICEIRSVQTKTLPTNVDLCGVVVSFKALVSFTSKDGKELVKSEIVLAGDSASSMSVTIWGDRAQKADKEAEGNPVMCIKGVIVKEWGNGRSGSLLEAGALLTSPTIPEAEKVRQWWSQGGSSQTLTALWMAALLVARRLLSSLPPWQTSVRQLSRRSSARMSSV
ncbi:unnamed protein product [Polarella glacialis]|uniref:Replication protein A OB domain-containing protein n=1 Tax=Polarella glacialis TaxID=89957 RepID=A0A813HD02_POLGL|nr:unnamed protein product [Polarella glacialis]CAE8680302.1 unnamed protein product [Polarella glacialis]